MAWLGVVATEDDYGAANGADLMDGTPRIALEAQGKDLYDDARYIQHLDE